MQKKLLATGCNFTKDNYQNACGNGQYYLYPWDNIDWNNFIFYQSNHDFLKFVRDNQFEIIKNHPVTLAHEKWVDEIFLPNLPK